jgi:preprotein translocase SecE subunit
MAVAVKTSPGARSGNPTGSPAILSLLGVAYLLGCLAVVFKLIPWLWWSLFDATGLAGRFSVELGTGLVLLCLAAGVGLLIFGGRLLGPHPPAGVRGGVFLGFAGLLLALLLARWASVWLEHWAYDSRWFSPTTGAILTALITAALLGGAAWLFFTARAQRFAAALEAGGWFHATAYKSNQGQKVRRATILGILLLVGAGVWTLISHGTLRRGPDNWDLNIPFTGKAAIEYIGDAAPVLAERPAGDKPTVEVRTPGAASYRAGQRVSSDDYRKEVEVRVKADPALEKPFRDALARWNKGKSEGADITAYVLAVNEVISERMQQLLEQRGASRTYPSDAAVNRLRALFYARSAADVSPVVRAFEREAADAKTTAQLGPAFTLPTAVLVVDQYVLRDVNDQLKPESRVRVGLTDGSFPLKFNQVVTTEEFGRAEVDVLARAAEARMARLRGGDRQKGLALIKELQAASKDGQQFKDNVQARAQETGGDVGAALTDLSTSLAQVRLPERLPLSPASGPITYASIPLLPSVRYTVPVLLLVLALWLAWRVVNMPVFADFLIATEAEMNKVSWTSQKRLFQDTFVVLTTVLLMAVFLFGTDWAWKVILSWEPIGVLYIPPEQKDTKTSVEQKRW